MHPRENVLLSPQNISPSNVLRPSNGRFIYFYILHRKSLDCRLQTVLDLSIRALRLIKFNVVARLLIAGFSLVMICIRCRNCPPLSFSLFLSRRRPRFWIKCDNIDVTILPSFSFLLHSCLFRFPPLSHSICDLRTTRTFAFDASERARVVSRLQ